MPKSDIIKKRMILPYFIINIYDKIIRLYDKSMSALCEYCY